MPLNIQDRLLGMSEPDYKAFQCRLMPTVAPERVLGVRTPLLRQLAKEISGTEEAESFLKELPHKYYDENNLHGFLLERIKDYERTVYEVDRFLPYVDNWATCDLMSPKVFGKHLPELLLKIKEWLASDRVYTVRFGIEMLMSFYLDGAFLPEYPEMVAAVKGEDYYIRMMVAWYFATALAKQYEAVIPFIKERRLDTWTHNKTIQKAVESYRITGEQKAFLRTLKIRESR